MKKILALLVFALTLLVPSAVAQTTYEPVVYPAQQTAVGNAALNVSNGTYTFSNNLFSASFVQTGDQIKFGGCSAMSLKAGTELFTVTFGDGTTVKASQLTSPVVTSGDLTGNDKAVKGSDHYNGKYLQAVYTYTKGEATLTLTWRAELRDGSHYLRTDLTVRSNKDIAMKSFVPMQYIYDTTTGGTAPEKLGNVTYGNLLMNDKIFAGLETPMGQNSVGDSDGETYTAFPNVSNWTKDLMTWTPSSIPSALQSQNGVAYTAANYLGTQGLVTFSTSGSVTATFQYQTGACGLWVAGIELVNPETGTVESSNYNLQFTGGGKQQISYTLANVEASKVYLMRFYYDSKKEGAANRNTSNGNITWTSAPTAYTPTGSSAADKYIKGLWSRNTTLYAYAPDTNGELGKDMEWNVSTVVGLVNPAQKRRSYLAYHERERAVPWRPFPLYNSWYELNINRKDADDPANNMTTAQAVGVVNQWKEHMYNVYGEGIQAYVWDDGWDQYGTWEPHANFTNGFAETDAIAKTMNTGIGCWLGPRGGYGHSADLRRKYWTDKGSSHQLSQPDFFKAFMSACSEKVKNYDFRFFKFDGISTLGTAYGPQNEEDAEGIITVERLARKMREDLFFNTTVGTWASPFWFHFADAIWRQENDHGTIGTGANDREKWITYRDNLVHKIFTAPNPYCPINSIMTHGFILSTHGGSSDRSYNSVLNELRCAFCSGDAMVELYADADLLNTINGGILWEKIAECIKWQKDNADVLPDVHWVGGDPWDETNNTHNIYGWASWNGTKATLTLRNGDPNEKTYTTTLREALDIPSSFTGKIYLKAAFGDQFGALKEICGIDDNTAIDPTQSITFTLPGSSVYVFNGKANAPVEAVLNTYTVTTTDMPNGATVTYKGAALGSSVSAEYINEEDITVTAPTGYKYTVKVDNVLHTVKVTFIVPLTFESAIKDGATYAFVNIQPTDPRKMYYLYSEGTANLKAASADECGANIEWPTTAQFVAVKQADNKFAFKNVANNKYLAYQTFIDNIDADLSTWSVNNGTRTCFSDIHTFWFGVNKRGSNNNNNGTIILKNDGSFDNCSAGEYTAQTGFSNNFGLVLVEDVPLTDIENAFNYTTNSNVTATQLAGLTITFTGDNAANVKLSATQHVAYLTPKASTPAQVKAQNGKFNAPRLKAAGETPEGIAGEITATGETGKFSIAFPEDQITEGDYEVTIPAGTFYVGTTAHPVAELKANYTVAEEPAPVGNPATEVHVTFSNTGTSWEGVTFNVAAKDKDGNDIEGVTVSEATGTVNPKQISIGNDNIGLNYQTNTSPGSATVTFTITGVPAGSSFDTVSLPLYSVKQGGGHQNGSKKEVNVALSVSGGVTTAFNDTKNNFDINATPGSLNGALVFTANDPIVATGAPITVSFTFSKGDTNEGCYMALHSLNLTTYVEPAKTFDATKVYTIHEPDDSRGYMAYNPANDTFVGLADVTLNGYQNKHAKTETSGEDITHWNIIEEPAGTVKLYNIQHEKYLGLNGSNQATWVDETDAATFTYTTENDGETYLFQSTKTASNNYLNPSCGYEANNGPVRLGSKENTSDWTIAEVVTPTLQDRHLYTIKGEFSDGSFAPVVCENNVIKGGANGATPETFVFFETTHTNDAGLTPVFNLGTVEGNGYFNYNAKGNANVNKANAAAVAFPTSTTELSEGWSFEGNGFKEGYYGMVGLSGTNTYRTYVVKPSTNIDYNTRNSSNMKISASNNLGATSAWCMNYVIEEVKGYTVYDIVNDGSATVSYNGEAGNCLTTVAQGNGGYIVLKDGVTPSESNLNITGIPAGYTAAVSVSDHTITITATADSPEAVITAPIDYNPLNGSGSVWSTWGEREVPQAIKDIDATNFTAANLRVIEKEYNDFPADKYLQSTFQYTSGTKRTDIVGVEILKDGEVVFSDYHFGWTGSNGNKLDNVYVLGPVAETGTYTVRYISTVQSAGGEKNVDTNGTITNALLNTGTYTVHITNPDMVTSGTPQVTYKDANYSENGQFNAPSGTVKVGDIDSAHDYLGVNVEIVATGTDAYTVNATYVTLYHPTWRTDGFEGEEGVTHPLKADGTKYMIYDSATERTDNWTGFMYPRESGNPKLWKTDPCTPLEFKGPEKFLWTIEKAGETTDDGFYLKNVATGKYYDCHGAEHATKEAAALLYIQNFPTATMSKADSTAHSNNFYEEPIVDISDDKGCWVVGGSQVGNNGSDCWNGQKAAFNNWPTSSPFCFYEVVTLEKDLQNTEDIKDVLIDYCQYFEGTNDKSHDFGTFQQKVEDAEALPLTESFTEYVRILREVKDMAVSYPQPITVEVIDPTEGTQTYGPYGRFITVRNSINQDYLKGSSLTLDRAVMWLNTDNELVSYDTGLGYSGIAAAEAIADGKVFEKQTLSEASPTRGTLVVKNVAGKYMASSGSGAKTSLVALDEATTTNATTWYVDNADYVVANIPASGYTTFYAPVPMEVPDGVEAYIITADEGQDETGLNICTLTLNSIGFIPAQTAVVLAGEQGAVKLDVMYGTYGSESEKRVRADEDSYWVFPEFNEYVAATNVLKGYDYTCTNQQTSTSDGVDGKFIYTLSNGKFQYYTGATIKAFKCFLELTQDYRAGHNRAATNPFRIIINGETEGISGAKTSSDNNAFDLSGRRINVQSERGLYILNGKKVIR